MSLRPRGFITDWKPTPRTIALIDQVRAVLAEYAEQLPLTLRQIFYRLVGAYLYEKTENAYERLGEALNKARRARMIDMTSIRDDGFIRSGGAGYDDVEHFLRAIELQARELKLDRQQGQARRTVLWCEASGMVPQIGRIADPYGIEVMSSGGFDSTTDKHRLGAEWAEQSITVLHLGDHDLSGVHVFSSLAEDIEGFAREYGADVEFVRLAVTPKQARLYNLPSAPRKATDKRRFDGDETWQCEALDPRTLAAIVQAAIDERIDLNIYQAMLDREEEARLDVLARLRPRRRRR
jgi:hypothetical protein